MRNATRTKWRVRVLLGGALVPLLLGSGCQSTSNTETGLLAGGGIGALMGALIAGPRHALAGALAGGAIGAAAGGLTGASEDKSQQRTAQAVAAQQAAQQAALEHPPFSLEDVVRLTGSGVSDEVIITQIRTSCSRYLLTADQIVWLQNNGVRPPVIQEMQATALRGPPPVYAGAPGQAVYVVQPSPPPPPVGVGVTFERRW